MRLPTRAYRSRNISNFIYNNGILTTSTKNYSYLLYQSHIHNIYQHLPSQNTNIYKHLTYVSIPRKNTHVLNTPMATKSPRRGPRPRIHNSSKYPPKTRRVWSNPHRKTLPNHLNLDCSYCNPRFHVRGRQNSNSLHPTNRYKIHNRLLISKSYSPGYRRHLLLRMVGVRGCLNYNNRPRTHQIRPIRTNKYIL